MGYSDLNVVGSDTASDAASYMIEVMVKQLRKELKQKSISSYNTCGVINVAMILDELIIPCEYYAKFGGDDLIELARLTAEKLQKVYEVSKEADWSDTKGAEENKQWHLNTYKRLLKRLNKFVKSSEY